MSALLRSLRNLTTWFFRPWEGSKRNNGSITVSEADFHENASHFIRMSLEKQQVVVHDESGKVTMVIGRSGLDLFPEEMDDPEPAIESADSDTEAHLYDSWLR